MKIGWVRKGAVQESNISAQRGLKHGCSENGYKWCVAVLRFVRMCHLYLVDGLLYEKLGFVGSYDLERCALLCL